METMGFGVIRRCLYSFVDYKKMGILGGGGYKGGVGSLWEISVIFPLLLLRSKTAVKHKVLIIFIFLLFFKGLFI